jgi:hypothetical protein
VPTKLNCCEIYIVDNPKASLPNYQPIRLGDGSPLGLPLEWEEARPKLRAISFEQFVLSNDPRLTRWYNAARFDREPPSDWPGTWRDAPKEKLSPADGTSPANLAPQSMTEPTSKIGGDLSEAAADENTSAPNEQPHVTPTSTPSTSSEPQSPATAAENSPQPSAKSAGLDKIQTTLDAVGAAEPTPFADGTNAVISLVRAATEPGRRKEHFSNAAISAIAVIPYVGDLAKASKYGSKAAKSTSTAAKSAPTASAAQGYGSSVSNVTTSSLSSLVTSLAFDATASSGSPSTSQAANPSTSASGGRGGAGGASGGSGGTGGPGNPTPPPAPGSPPGGQPGQPQQVNSILTKLWDGLKNVFEKVAPFAGQVANATFAFITFNTALYAANRAQLKLNENLRLYSGEIQAAYMRLEAGRVMRDVTRARSVEGNLAGLSDAQNRLERAQEEFTRPLQQVVLNLQTKITDGVAAILELVDSVEGITEWMEEFFRKESEQISSRNLIDAIERRRQQQRDEIQQQMTEARRHFQGGQRPTF